MPTADVVRAATDRGEDLVRCQDAKELFGKLGL